MNDFIFNTDYFRKTILADQQQLISFKFISFNLSQTYFIYEDFFKTAIYSPHEGRISILLLSHMVSMISLLSPNQALITGVTYLENAPLISRAMSQEEKLASSSGRAAILFTKSLPGREGLIPCSSATHSKFIPRSLLCGILLCAGPRVEAFRLKSDADRAASRVRSYFPYSISPVSRSIPPSASSSRYMIET